MMLPVVFAADDSLGAELFSNLFIAGFVHSLLYGLLGIGLLLIAVKLFDLISPRIDIQAELGEKKNTAVAIVVGAIILGVCYLVGVAIH